MPVVLSTDAIAPHERFEFWHDVVGEKFVEMNFDFLPGRARPFNGRIVLYSQGALGLGEVIAESHLAIRDRRMLARATEEAIIVLLQREGTSRFAQDGRQAELTAGSLCVCDTTRPFEMALTSRIRHTVVRFAGPRIRRLVPDIERFAAQAIRCDRGAGAIFSDAVDALRRESEGLDPQAAGDVGDAFMHLLAAALHARADGPRPDAGLKGYHRQRVKAYLRQHLRDPGLTVDSIARGVGLSSRYLHEVFAAEGIAIMKWVWQERLERCRQELAMTVRERRRISDVALAWGFSDAAHFSRAFRQRFDVSPRDYRRDV